MERRSILSGADVAMAAMGAAPAARAAEGAPPPSAADPARMFVAKLARLSEQMRVG